MRQEGSRTVAPLNEEPRWPEGYLAVLREAGAIEKQLPYYVAWVRRFFARYPGRRRRDLGRAEIEAFLLASSREKGITNWRLAQGRAALELYYERFRGIGLAPRVSEGAEQGGNSRGERSEVRFQRSGNSRGEKGGGSAALSTPAQGRWMGREGAGGGEFSQRLEVRGNREPEQPLRSASAATEQPKSLSAAGRRRFLVKTGTAEEPHGQTRTDTDGHGRLEGGECRGERSGGVEAQAGGMGRVVVNGGRVNRDARTNWGVLEAKVRECLRVAHYAYRTEQTYVGWIRQFVEFHGGRRPSTMGAQHVKDYLRHLAEERQVAASTQNQALNAIVFLFKRVLGREMGDFSDFQRARRGICGGG